MYLRTCRELHTTVGIHGMRSEQKFYTFLVLPAYANFVFVLVLFVKYIKQNRFGELIRVFVNQNCYICRN